MATPTPLAPGLTRKVNKLVALKPDAPALVESLHALGEFYGDNTPAARRGLRSAIDKRGLAINEEFLCASEAAQRALEAVEAHLSGLLSCCERMSAALATSTHATAGLLERTEALNAELAANERRAALVADFLDKYQLSPDEVVLLREGDVSSDAFFAALRRVATIHANCRSLLRRHHQRAGLELMDAMALYQESGYERLCRWACGAAKQLGSASDAPPQLSRALAALSSRPALRRAAVEEAASVRQHALFGRFIGALTRGGESGAPRPLEQHAHDARRFIGDMAAWLHGAAAGEKEFAEQLLSGEAPRPALATAPSGDPLPDEGDSDGVVTDAAWLVDRVLEGVTRPFKVRADASLAASPSAALRPAFQLAQALRFHASTFATLLGQSCCLAAAVGSVAASAEGALAALVASRAERLRRFPPAAEPLCGVPPALVETAQRVTELVTPPEGSPEAVALALTLLEPAMGAVSAAASQLKGTHPAAFTANCASLFLGALATATAGDASGTGGAPQQDAALASRVAELSSLRDSCLSSLASHEAERLLAEAGLGAAATEAAAKRPGRALHPSLSVPALATLYGLVAASAAPLDPFNELVSRADRSAVSRAAALQLADAYDAVVAALGGAHPTAKAEHPPHQFRTICEGL